MWRMLQQDTPGDYVLATGVSLTVRDFANFVAEALGMKLDWNGVGIVEYAIDRKSGKRVIEVSERFFRPAEVDLLLGDPSKAAKVLGWKPRVSVQQLAEMMARADYEAWQPE
jgi:GDPmannose 4,6-dehydratase